MENEFVRLSMEILKDITCDSDECQEMHNACDIARFNDGICCWIWDCPVCGYLNRLDESSVRDSLEDN